MRCVSLSLTRAVSGPEVVGPLLEGSISGQVFSIGVYLLEAWKRDGGGNVGVGRLPEGRQGS